jgi:hypothetical protein
VLYLTRRRNETESVLNSWLSSMIETMGSFYRTRKRARLTGPRRGPCTERARHPFSAASILAATKLAQQDGGKRIPATVG